MCISVDKNIMLKWLAFLLLAGQSLSLSLKKPQISFDKYHHQQDLENLFNRLAQDYPDKARVGDIGTSVQGRKLIYIELTNDVQVKSPWKPQVKLVGNMHGDETVGRQLIVYLAQFLLYEHDSDSDAINILNNTRLFLLPSMNPDGFEASEEGRCRSLAGYRGRKNGNGVDLNRNFPDQFDTEGERDARKYEKETMLMMDWIKNNKFILSANFHAGSEVASYPFDSRKLTSHDHSQYGVASLAPDNDFFIEMASTYANNHYDMHVNNRKCGEDLFEDGITNGAKWYIVRGGMQDFNYLYGECMEITLYITCCKYPLARFLQKEWDKNKMSLIKFVQLANRGLRGQVTDADGNPVDDVTIHVSGIAYNVTTDVTGIFFRMLTGGGIYNVTYFKKGYEPVRRTIYVPENDFVIDNIQLHKEKKVPSQFTVPLERSTDGRMLSIRATRADALKYCQENYPNGQLAVPTATADWLTQAGRIEMFKDVITGDATFSKFHLHLDYDHVTDDVSTVDGKLVAKGADFEDSFYFTTDEDIYLILSGDLTIMNGYCGLDILCQHD